MTAVIINFPKKKTDVTLYTIVGSTIGPSSVGVAFTSTNDSYESILQGRMDTAKRRADSYQKWGDFELAQEEIKRADIINECLKTYRNWSE